MLTLKILNPFIWIFNLLKYLSYLDMNSNCDEYVKYDFNKEDTKYF